MSEVLDTIRDESVLLTVNRLTGEVVTRSRVQRVLSGVVGVLGHMQPLSPKELRLVPPGLNTLEWWHIWALSELMESDEVTDGTAPTVTVQKLESWKEGPFWHAQATKVTDTAGIPTIIASVGSTTGSSSVSGVGSTV